MSNSDHDFAISSEGIARRFGPRWVLRGITLRVAPGEAVGLLGSNGCGKSTLLRVLGTLLAPSAGSALIYGSDVVRDPRSVRRDIGFLAHVPGLYEDLTARENLRFAAEMLGLDSPGLDAALDVVGLASVANERVRGFSAGMQRRLALARLLLRRPRLLLLDEPYSNLDADGIALMNRTISSTIDGGGAALVVLHELAPADGILGRLVRITEGRVSSVAEPAQAPTSFGPTSMAVA